MHHFVPWITAAASAAYVNDPEEDHTVPNLIRYSASTYLRGSIQPGWRSHLALIWGGITHYDHARFLNSFALEALHRNDREAMWGRIEALQRTPSELDVATAVDPLFVGALTLGYTRTLTSLGPADLSMGAMGTANFVPDVFSAAYGGNSAYVARLFVEARFMTMLGYND